MSTSRVKVKGQAAVTLLRDGKVVEYLNAAKTLKSGQFMSNLVLDRFFTYLISSINPQSSTVRIKVGTGSTEPAVDQTALVNMILPTGNHPAAEFTRIPAVEAGVLDITYRYVSTFPLGSVVGNLSEAGLEYTSSAVGDTLHTRLLFKDPEGDPTTVPVTAEDQLIITYDMIYSIPVSSAGYSVDGTDDGSPVSTTVTGFMNNFDYMTISNIFTVLSATTAASGTLNYSFKEAQTTTESGVTDTSGWQGVSITYVNRVNVLGGKEVDLTVPISAANFSLGIGSFRDSSNNLAPHRFSFNPRLPKDADKQLIMTFRREYARA